MSIEQLVGRRERIRRELALADAHGDDDVGRRQRLQRELAQVELEMDARCLPRLTEVVFGRAA